MFSVLLAFSSSAFADILVWSGLLSFSSKFGIYKNPLDFNRAGGRLIAPSPSAKDNRTLTEVFTITEIFPCFFLSCKANGRVKLAKTGHGPHSSTLVVICAVRLLFVLFYVLFVCKCKMPLGDNPTAVNKYIISYHIELDEEVHPCDRWDSSPKFHPSDG
jgi:hypothetical protein